MEVKITNGSHRGRPAHPMNDQGWLRVRGYISTVGKHGDNIMNALRDAITGDPWKPPLAC
jgi:hypothetical protein